jgi:ParB/RepB/Spo0J family partition protein
VRETFKQEDLEALARSFQEAALSQPILLRAVAANTEDARDASGQSLPAYEVISGELRLRAAKLLGWTTIRSIVEEMTDREAAMRGFDENEQRHELNIVERAKGYKMLMGDPCNLSQGAIASRMGLKDPSTVSRTLAILEQPPEIQRIMSRDIIGEGHCRYFSRIKDLKKRIAFAARAEKEQWTVRETEKRVKKMLAGKPSTPNDGQLKPYSNGGFKAHWNRGRVVVRCPPFNPSEDKVKPYIEMMQEVLETVLRGNTSPVPGENLEADAALAVAMSSPEASADLVAQATATVDSLEAAFGKESLPPFAIAFRHWQADQAQKGGPPDLRALSEIFKRAE